MGIRLSCRHDDGVVVGRTRRRLLQVRQPRRRFVPVRDTHGWGLPSGAIPPWRPAITNFNDKFRVTAPVGSFAPNPWGLHDMIGNAAEWTLSDYRPGEKVVRGGSFADRPQYATASYRLCYPPWQRVYNVGFRILCESAEPGKNVAQVK